MEEITTSNVPNEPKEALELIPEEDVKETKKSVTKSRRGQQPRSIEVLESISVSEMSPAELIKYVDHLRQDNNMLRSQLRTMQDSFAGLQKQKQELETEQHKLAVAAKTQIQFCKDTVAQAYKTLAYMQPLEVE